MIRPIPEGFHTITPTFVFKDCRKAIAFYKKAFGAVEQEVMPSPDGRGIMHASLRIGDSTIMMGEERPDCPGKSAETLGGSPISLYVYVKDVDMAFQQAVDAGGDVQMPLDDMFWGDRAGSIKDPFGYTWMLGTHVKDLSPEEIAEGAKEAFAAMAK